MYREGGGLCVWLCPSSLRRWSLFLLVGFTDPYIHTYSESLWWKLIKNHLRGHKYKDKDNDKEKDSDKVPEKPNICYSFEILMTYSFQIWWYIPHPGHPDHVSHPGYIRSVLQGLVYHRFGIFLVFSLIDSGGRSASTFSTWLRWWWWDEKSFWSTSLYLHIHSANIRNRFWVFRIGFGFAMALDHLGMVIWKDIIHTLNGSKVPEMDSKYH